MEFYKNNFQNFLKAKKIQPYFRFADKGPIKAERVIGTIRNFLKKPLFQKGNADWLSEYPSAINQYKNAIHNSTKKKPIDASKNSNKKEVCSNFRDAREKQKPNFHLRQLVRTFDIKRVFSDGDSTNWSNKVYTITEVIHDTIPLYRID